MWREWLIWALRKRQKKKLEAHAHLRELQRKVGMRPRVTRPASITLTIEFELHPNGKVYCSPKSDGTMHHVTDKAIVMLVQAAFRVMAEEARTLLGRKKLHKDG